MSWDPLTYSIGGAFCSRVTGQNILGVKLDGVATIEIGTVTTLPAGSEPVIYNSGTRNHAVLNFEIPAGPDGVGIASIEPVGEDDDGGKIYRVHLTDGTDYDFTVPMDSNATDKHYVHSQSTASDTWVIRHNLGKCPSVTVFDSAGQLVQGDIEYNNENTLTLTFTAAFAGKAYLN